MKTMVFTFGRFQTPTVGHEKLIKKVVSLAHAGTPNIEEADWRIYLSHTQDKKKNPLPYQLKVKYLTKAFPFAAQHIYIDKENKIRDPFDVFYQLSDEHYDYVYMVVGSDRVNDFKSSWTNFLKNAENKKSVENIQSVKFVSAGYRDPDADGVEGMSASKLRNFAVLGNFDAFTSGLPTTLKPIAKEIYREVRRGLGFYESWLFNFKSFIKII